jgi:hypothetical protein
MDTAESADRLSFAEIVTQVNALTNSDWRLLRYMARMTALGLNGRDPEDLLQDALAKLCEGVRVWRRGTHILVTVKVLMHSIASNERKKDKIGPIDWNVVIDAAQAGASHDNSLGERFSDGLTPEHFAESRKQLEYMGRLVSGDQDARMLLIRDLGGLEGEDISGISTWTAKREDAARKRLTTRLWPLKELRKTV